MKYLKLATVLAGVLLAAGMGSANLLDSFGMVSGEADVEGPTFYIAEIDDEDVLKINEAPSSDEEINARKLTDGFGTEFFTSDEVSPAEWYEMNPEFFVEVRADSDEDEGDNIEVSLLYDTQDSSDNLICSENIQVNDSDDYKVLSADCSGDPEHDEIERFKYKLTGGSDSEFWINDDTRVEVNAQE